MPRCLGMLKGQWTMRKCQQPPGLERLPARSHSRFLALDFPLHVVYCRNDEVVVGVLGAFPLFVSLGVRFPFFVVAKRNPPSLVSLPYCCSVSVSSSPFARRARVGRPAGERFCRRCNEGVHDGLDSGARAMLSCNRSRAYRFPDDLEALRGDWRRFSTTRLRRGAGA